jgi:hypothetical protein
MTAVKLGQILIRHRFITPAQLEEGLTVQVTDGGRLGSNLVDLGFVSVNDVARALGQQHQIAAASDEAFRSVKSSALQAVSRELCAKYGVFPLAVEGNTLHLAMRDPQDARRSELGQALGFEVIKPYATPDMRLLYFMELLYKIPRPKRYLRAAGEGDGGWRGNLEPTINPQVVSEEVIIDHSEIEVEVEQSVTHHDALRTGPHRQISPAPQSAPAPTSPAAAAGDEFELVYLDEVEREEEDLFDLDIDIAFDEPTDVPAQDTQPMAVPQLLTKLQQAGERETIISLLLQPVLAKTSISLSARLAPKFRAVRFVIWWCRSTRPLWFSRPSTAKKSCAVMPRAMRCSR